MDADSQWRPKPSVIESHEQRRMRLLRNRRQRELYGPTHRRRREAARRIERGEFPICPRCGLGIGPDDLWDLGHDDVDLRIERPEHRACNRAAANQLKTSREW
jgi:hypothetical protein